MAQEPEKEIRKLIGDSDTFEVINEDPVLGSLITKGKIAEFKIPIQAFISNIMICGDLCSGKSSLIKRLLLQIIENTNLNPILFDENNEYNKFFDSRWLEREAWVFEFGNEDYSINPLELIGDGGEYFDNLLDIFRTSFKLSTEELFILREFISLTMKELEKPKLSDLNLYLDCWDEVIKIFPEDLIKNSIAHLKMILTGLTSGPNKEILDVKTTNLNFEKLQDFPIVIKFRNISRSSKIFIKNLVILKQLIYKNDKKNPRPHLLVLDQIEDVSHSLLMMNKNNLKEGLLASIGSPLKGKENYFDHFDNYILLHQSSRKNNIFFEEKFNLEDLQLNRMEMGESLVKLSNKPIRKIQIEDFYF
ncbi:MAG: hypothetical protein GF329_17205 [Candidatus Lokiarchaeota archaeon]|nr:hypothetical protein [Candidatus Lokiarchaeota archaeon]